MPALLLLLLVLPAAAAIAAYVKWGLMAGVVVGASTFVAMGLLIGLPFAALVRAKKREALDHQQEPITWIDDRP